ncbi:type II toxin-antitoxin system YafQ family toxin [Acinetobacter sp. WCHAc060025]|uniref:Type II toxin-antitoxin system YafQ family toxin n=2 Tax=Moraxellaceae TaxID=468 RepID=A0A3G2T7X7_9GAMM|nr:type II toxin-antitoxin system YafQ family toxin [Acinetobacter wuhouensis]RZG74673.1 type II toxin-antitoxin system YafQ family toxin [Acinetobacter wuhouensis]RZG76563.1 type II toxin-antitoxin system YafQ family toxin [Acinetobacter sp. WCHAc060025]
MNSNKTMKNKRAVLARSSDYTKEFLADWQRLSRTGRYDMTKLKKVMMLLIANDEPLGAEWKDHALTGNWVNYRELHVGGDFLLIYRIEPLSKFEMIVFVRAGTHSELF